MFLSRVKDQSTPFFISHSDIERLSTIPIAIAQLERVLLQGFDPEKDGVRSRLTTQRGQLLLMPSSSARYTGTKLLTISPANASTSLPVIQGLYVLFSGADQRPLAVLDGTGVTNLRTPAVSALGAQRLVSTGGKHLLVFGTGQQAWQHIKALTLVLELTHVEIVGRNEQAAAQLAARAAAKGIKATVGTSESTAKADLIVCCTGSSTPLFDGASVKDNAVVIAIGSHEPNSRELDDTLMSRATIYVESLVNSRREAGDVILALASGAIASPTSLNTLAELVQGRIRPQLDRPAVFKTTGMPWQDLAVAAGVYEAHLSETQAGQGPQDPH